MTKKTLILVMICISLCLVGFKCNSDEASSSESSKLSPDEWLEQYNAAWTECNNQVPQVQTFSGDPNFVNLVSERTRQVNELVQESYPELCSYLDIPEYRDKLNQQGANAYNQLIQDGEDVIDQQEEELEQQQMIDQQQLDNQKEANDRFLRNYSAPQYVP